MEMVGWCFNAADTNKQILVCFEIHFAVVEGTQITRFLIKMNHKISHLKGLQYTTTYGSGALASAQSTRTLFLPPTTFLFMWLRNKICFAVVVGTKTTR